MPRTRKHWLMALLGLLLVCAGTVAAAVVPRVGAAKCLLHFQAALPADVLQADPAPAGFERLTAGAPGWLRRGPSARAPVLVFVHGVAPVGVGDGRILRAIEALGRAGFTVLAPEIAALVDPLAPGPVGGELDGMLDALAAGRYEGVRPDRFGLVGVSVGGALALSAGAAFMARGGSGLFAVLAIGAPDDIEVLSHGWFEAVDPARKSDGSFGWERLWAAAFARSFFVRAALAARSPGQAEGLALGAWLASEPLPREPLPADLPPALRALGEVILAAPAARAAARADVLREAWPRLARLSPAHADLGALRGVAVFLLHGAQDPLVPVAQARLLEARLARHTLVTVLESRMLDHTGVASAGLGESLAHLVFLDDFLDMIDR